MTALVPLLPIIVAFLVFPIASIVTLRLTHQTCGVKLFTLINILGSFGLCMVGAAPYVRLRDARPFIAIGCSVFLFYLVLVIVQYINIRLAVSKRWRSSYLPLLFPIFLLAILKYVPGSSEQIGRHLVVVHTLSATIFFLGLSYMSFRLCHLALEVRNGVVECPDIWEYLSFAFFVPTFTIGPISPFSAFQRSLHNPNYGSIPLSRSFLRILVGLTKYLFLGNLLNQLTYQGLLLDGHPHPKIDLLIAVFAYYLYLYCNFSGYCDMAIGTAGLLGIDVHENFDHPLVARNILDFWNRWHITLSVFMRDTVFSPLSKALAMRLGPRRINHAIAISIFIVFLLIGIWHGVGVNFVLFGVFQAIGVACCHYYTVFLKKKLGKRGYAAYMSHPVIHAFAVGITFVFAATSLFLFANTPAMAATIWSSLR
jgi:D-alanyl-lipoteichoic acid acyltransferase DltB (MBOAT superfamily)